MLSGFLILSVCTRCRDDREADNGDMRGGLRLARRVAAAFPKSDANRAGVRLQGVRCLSQCKRSCAMALSASSRFTYIFGDLDPHRDVDDVLAVAALYAASPDGFMRRDTRPPPMRCGVLGRIPPLDIDPDHALIEPLSSLITSTEPNI